MKFFARLIAALLLVGGLWNVGFAQQETAQDQTKHDHMDHDHSQHMQADALAPQVISAARARVGALDISNGFTRAMPPAARTGGGFLSITNTGATDDRLLAVRSPQAGKMELHDMTMRNDVMVMREIIGGLLLPAGETVHLAPGGKHMMFLQVETPFVKGTEVQITLQFEKAGTVELALPVAGIGATGLDQ